jgi:hypothetical protein
MEKRKRLMKTTLDKETQTEFIGLNVSPTLKAAALAAADKDRRTLADWVRLAIERALERKG